MEILSIGVSAARVSGTFHWAHDVVATLNQRHRNNVVCPVGYAYTILDTGEATQWSE